MRAFQVVKILNRNGWFEVRCRGSHHIFEHKETHKSVPVAYHDIREEIRPDVLRNLERQIGIKFKR